MAAQNRLTIVKKSVGSWNVTVSNPPTNMFDPLMFAELNGLVRDMAKSPELRIVVFESKVKAAGLGQKGDFELNLPYAINDLA